MMPILFYFSWISKYLEWFFFLPHFEVGGKLKTHFLIYICSWCTENDHSLSLLLLMASSLLLLLDTSLLTVSGTNIFPRCFGSSKLLPELSFLTSLKFAFKTKKLLISTSIKVLGILLVLVHEILPGQKKGQGLQNCLLKIVNQCDTFHIFPSCILISLMYFMTALTLMVPEIG